MADSFRVDVPREARRISARIETISACTDPQSACPRSGNEGEVEADVERLMTFVENLSPSAPVAVIESLLRALDSHRRLEAMVRNNARLRAVAARAMGITPSSERRGSAQKPRAEDEPTMACRREILTPQQRLRHAQAHLKKVAQWQTACASKNLDKAAAVGKKLEQLQQEEATVRVEDDDTDAEQEAERKVAALHEATMQAAESGGGADASMASRIEALMHAARTTAREQTVRHVVDRDTLPKSAVIKQVFEESRCRYDFRFVVTKIDVHVEKLAVSTPRGETIVAADMDVFGPPKMRVTWHFLVNIVILASQYVMPFNRIAQMVSTHAKEFKASEISRYYIAVASQFCSIYVNLGQSLAHAPILVGDDTGSRVLEIYRARKKVAASPEHVPSWAPYATPEKASAALAKGAASLGARISCAFGFSSPRKVGLGHKTQFNTTTLSGRSHARDPYSTVVFYRSHLGSLGNLFDALLPHRTQEDGQLIIQSDLSTTNLISDEKLIDAFDILFAGCSAHARRPFAQYEKDDPEVCDWILHAFKAIPIFERLAHAFGRNEENVGRLRDVDQRRNWEFIKDQCGVLANRWSRETPLGKAARYVLKNYDKLTLYLDYPRVDATNNFSERMLRQEKLIENNSMFRQSLEGRFALDIMRTILQTCVAAGVDPHRYIVWVMRMPRESVDLDPAAFTPYAFRQLSGSEADDVPSDWTTVARPVNDLTTVSAATDAVGP